MRIPGGAILNPAAGAVRSFPVQTAVSSPAPAQKDESVDFSRRFDRVTISEAGADSARELQARLRQDVRAAASTDRIAALREQIRSGSYQPDPAEIARKMLLTGEAV